MVNSRRVFSAMRPIFSAFFVIATAFFALITIFSFVLKLTVANKENYVNAVSASTFSDKMMEYLRDDLEGECLFYDLPFSVLDNALSVEEIARFSREYIDGVYESLLRGKPLEIPEWSADSYMNAIESFFNSLPAEERPLDETAAITVGKEFSERALSLLKAGIQEKFLKLGYGIFSHPVILWLLEKNFLFLMLTGLAFAAALICNWHEWKRILYAECFALGISAGIAAIPFWLLKRYDFMKRIALMDSPLKLYVATIYNVILQKMVVITTSLFLVITVLFILSIVLRCVSFRKVDLAKKVQSNSIDESA